ncbi:MAG TPA: glycoside hydrolase family 3 N-terminal domain-containing protein [Solirubrobacteraceae bacterium]
MSGSDTRTAAQRRRLAALSAVAATAVAGGAFAGANSAENARTGSGSHGERSAALASAADLDRAVGQRIITAIDGVSPNAQLLRLARRGRIGGVILFARNIRSVAQVRRDMRRLQAAAPHTLLITVDQEGGAVKRFRSLPPTQSPRSMTVGAAAKQGAATATALRRAGVNVDLAPVADVTNNPRSFLYSRSHRSAAATCAFANGLAANGVKPTLKHFPGLSGEVNTDDARVTLPRPRPSIAYKRCGGAGLVMLSNARYRSLGSRPALLERRVYTLLREMTKAPTITDSIQAAALAGERHVSTRAVRAGVDFILSTGSQRTAEEIWLGLRGGLRAREILAGADRRAAFIRQLM